MGSTKPAPFDGWAQKNLEKILPETWRMLTWQELEECVASGLVLIGAHSHSHLKGSECTPGQLHDEAHMSADILRSRFGKPHAQIYAYPFGNSLLGHVPEDYENAVRSRVLALPLLPMSDLLVQRVIICDCRVSRPTIKIPLRPSVQNQPELSRRYI